MALGLASFVLFRLLPYVVVVQAFVPHRCLTELQSAKMKRLAHLCDSRTSVRSASHSFVLRDGAESQGEFEGTSDDVYVERVATSDVLSLDSIRSTLVRQEETIIFALIERAQFRRNDIIYRIGGVDALDADCGANEELRDTSFFSYMLRETEKLHAKVRRYSSPEEHPFSKEQLPAPVLQPLRFPALLCNNTVNVNDEILRWYIDRVIPALCVAGDDEQHGSSVLCDITALQALSKRIHLGKFVAESKFAADPATYCELLASDDVKGVVDLLTNVQVEERVLQRAYLKTSTYGMDITGETQGYKVNPSLIVSLYRDMIIPLTKHVEIQYLYQRVGRTPPFPETYMHHCMGDTGALDVDPIALDAKLAKTLLSRPPCT